MRPNWLAFVIATAAMAVVAIALLGPGAARPVTSARVWGGPWTETRSLALRIVLAEKLGGIVDLPAGRTLVVSAAKVGVGDRLATARAETGPDGAADVILAFREPPGRDFFLTVTDANGRALAHGRLAHATGRWNVESRPCELAGRRSGSLQVRVAATRGVFAAPFPGTLAIEVSHEGKPVQGARVYVRAPGTEATAAAPPGEEPIAHTAAPPDGPTAGTAIRSRPTDAAGLTEVTLVPLEHEVELSITVESAETLAAQWTGSLPVLPGANWLESIRPRGKPGRAAHRQPCAEQACVPDHRVGNGPPLERHHAPRARTDRPRGGPTALAAQRRRPRPRGCAAKRAGLGDFCQRSARSRQRHGGMAGPRRRRASPGANGITRPRGIPCQIPRTRVPGAPIPRCPPARRPTSGRRSRSHAPGAGAVPGHGRPRVSGPARGPSAVGAGARRVGRSPTPHRTPAKAERHGHRPLHSAGSCASWRIVRRRGDSHPGLRGDRPGNVVEARRVGCRANDLRRTGLAIGCCVGYVLRKPSDTEIDTFRFTPPVSLPIPRVR